MWLQLGELKPLATHKFTCGQESFPFQEDIFLAQGSTELKAVFRDIASLKVY